MNIKNLLISKKGVTVLEGVIALGLLALVAGGAFAVLLSASRQTTQPDIREEMTLAVDKANNLLRAYVGIADANGSPVPAKLRGGICCNGHNGDPTFCSSTPLALHTQLDISCQLPPICDANNSSFGYTVTNISGQVGTGTSEHTEYFDVVRFDITCNGYTL